jgi:hypothetical protein
VNKDNGPNNRFCWPTKDRARAESPSKAPRTSSVLTASVFFLHSPVSGPRRSFLFSSFAPFSRASCSTHGLGGTGAHEVCCGYCKIGLPGQPPSFRKAANESRGHLQVPTVAGTDRPICRKGGVALGCSPRRTSFVSASASPEQDLAEPDWRIIGAQDVSEPLCCSSSL